MTCHFIQFAKYFSLQKPFCKKKISNLNQTILKKMLVFFLNIKLKTLRLKNKQRGTEVF